jgi:glyoxylase-like metal-dependent hydrolase (beta-lactamase superfamily II)
MCTHHAHNRRQFLKKSGSAVLAANMIPAGVDHPSASPGTPFSTSSRPRQISPSLYWLGDTCNVYLVKDGNRGLLIDFGSGKMLESTGELGITGIDWLLHTHHHRDQAQGDQKAAAQRIPIAVPAHERHLFEDAENFWRNRRVYHLYHVRNDFFTLSRNIPVADLLWDYETFRWGGHEFYILPTPGHTAGSITLLAKIDGRKVAFSGDLIYSPGKVQTLHDLQYQYGAMDGVDLAVSSLTRLLEQKPDLVCPSHGEPFADPLPGISQLVDKLSGWFEYWREGSLTVRNQPFAVSPHLVASNQTTSSFYAVISDSGKGLFLDYGSASWNAFEKFNDVTSTFDRMRFVEHTIDVLKARYGLKSVDVAIPSHMHDDHINGFPHLARHYGTRIWCYENMVDILENPRGRNLGCILAEPLKVERSFRHRESFRWEEFEFSMVHSPGHTDFQMALFATIDGTRIAFTGDAFFNNSAQPGTDQTLRHNLIYRNDVESDSHLKSVRNILEFEPALIAPGHGSPFLLNRDDARQHLERLKKMEEHMKGLVAGPEVNIGLDPSWVHIYPYQLRLLPGQRRTVEVRVRNHYSRVLVIEAALVLPPGWICQPRTVAFEVPAKGKATGEFQISLPDGWKGPCERVAIAADVVAGGKYVGEIAEAVVDLRPERPWPR